MRILQVASEAFPLAKTGGLGDVTTGLCQALVDQGEDVRLLIPAYRGCAERAGATHLCELGDPLGLGPTRLLEGVLPESDIVVWLLDCPALFDRPGGPYVDESGRDFGDNAQRFGLLCRVAALLGLGGCLLGWTPDVVHCHDWQAALTAAHLRLWGGKRPATVMTIHNLQFHGLFDPIHLPRLGLPGSVFDTRGIEFHGAASFLKGGLYYADRLTTVSPSYAEEIQTPSHGEGLHGLLSTRSHDLVGILNGIDERVWNPATDAHLEMRYDVDHLDDKLENKLALQAELGLRREPGRPVIGWVGRLTPQKGMDLVLESLGEVLRRGAQLVVVGTGERELEQRLTRVAATHPSQIAFFGGYDEALSHRVFAGVDLLLVPSRFEPCGLTQLYAMRYGTLPLVRATGGLRDTVVDADEPGGTGFVFAEPSARALGEALHRALDMARDAPGRWRDLQRRAMRHRAPWHQSAESYRGVYAQAVTPTVGQTVVAQPPRPRP